MYLNALIFLNTKLQMPADEILYDFQNNCMPVQRLAQQIRI